MKCSKCESVIDEDAIICSNCGSKLSNPVEDTSGFSDLDDHNGVRKKSQPKAHTKFFYGKARYTHEVSKLVDRFLISHDLETQIIENNNEIIVQGKKKSNIIIQVLGMDQSVTVGISVEGNDIQITMGHAKWIDKAVGELSVCCFSHRF